ncbi:hypothetical protein JTE90_027647 [Oedothorax gibbosus]|uniref:Uncharacterized protein n=1 Tax=Oedothorax gibbosus TaxID=931172 RepID=A0AAV6UR18_9ARAC|nr:hypothetical protein JTE90_027647 [Oedothorax gibbosus]
MKSLLLWKHRIPTEHQRSKPFGNGAAQSRLCARQKIDNNTPINRKELTPVERGTTNLDLSKLHPSLDLIPLHFPASL